MKFSSREHQFKHYDCYYHLKRMKWMPTFLHMLEEISFLKNKWLTLLILNRTIGKFYVLYRNHFAQTMSEVMLFFLVYYNTVNFLFFHLWQFNLYYHDSYKLLNMVLIKCWIDDGCFSFIMAFLIWCVGELNLTRLLVINMLAIWLS